MRMMRSMMTMRMLVVVVLLKVALAVAASTRGTTDLCPLPAHARPWNATLLTTETRIVWDLDVETTCQSYETCFPHSGLGDGSLPVQLLPVEIPYGAPLSFDMATGNESEWDLVHSMVYEVDVNGFLSCDVSRGLPLWTLWSSSSSSSPSSPYNDSDVINTTVLSPGSHYFVVDYVNESMAQCKLGLRVNITVKPNRCPVQNGRLCSANGFCVTHHGQTEFSCFCCGGHRGESCDQYELCPCQNGGQCRKNSSASADVLCVCLHGFRGKQCEERVTDMCEIITCRNNGTCSGNATHFRCACVPGFSGSHCEVNVNECASNPCINGVCVDRHNGYACYCRPGYHGHRCELDYDECATVPCENDGFCQNLQDNYTCHCHPGFKGRNCSTKIHACSKLQPCLNGARCQEMVLTYKCICPRGFSGAHCEVNIDDCARHPCLNGGTCVDQVGSYTCLCLDMHAGPNCQFPLDMFGPMIDIRGLQEGGLEERAFHVRNMYVVSGTLSCAVVVVLVVLVTCYCRVRSARPSPSSILRRHHEYTRHHDEPTHPVDISSVSNPRLSVDAIWEATSLNYDVTQLGSPVRRGSLKPLDI